MERLVATFCVVIGVVCWSAQATAHPADEYEPLSLPANYGMPGFTMKADWSFDDVVFPESYPDPESLSNSEKYMLVGAVSPETGYGLRPWHELVLGFVSLCDAQSRVVPDRLSAELISEVWATAIGDESLVLDDAQLAEYASPISGDYPLLNANTFSAGNMYIRALTLQECERVAEHHYNLRLLIDEGVTWNLQGEDKLVRGELASPVFYFRVYGEQDTILTGIWFEAAPT